MENIGGLEISSVELSLGMCHVTKTKIVLKDCQEVKTNILGNKQKDDPDGKDYNKVLTEDISAIGKHFFNKFIFICDPRRIDEKGNQRKYSAD